MSEWISVEDRYPGSDMDGVGVVVAVKTSDGRVASETDAWHWFPREINGGLFYFWGSKVTHWQPLPPPPSE